MHCLLLVDVIMNLLFWFDAEGVDSAADMDNEDWYDGASFRLKVRIQKFLNAYV